MVGQAMAGRLDELGHEVTVGTRDVAASLADTILMDLSNPLDFSQRFPPTLFVKDTGSLGELIQAALPQARDVKTLNTLATELMVRPGQLAGDHTDVTDLGDITSSRGAEMFLPLWLRVMQTLGTGMFNVKVVREP